MQLLFRSDCVALWIRATSMGRYFTLGQVLGLVLSGRIWVRYASICRSLIQKWLLFTLGIYFCLSIFGWHIVQDLHVELFVGSKPICRGFVVTPSWIVHGMK